MAPSSGDIFGAWTVLHEGHKRGYHRHFVCRCRCGRVKEIYMGSLTRGVSHSCGCWIADANRARNTTHGMRRRPEYRTWSGMKTRCCNSSNPAYRLYGGRGISICDRWRNSFETFLADMGSKPYPGATIERIDNNGNYEPKNCRWASQAEQARNTRRNLFITHDGITMASSEWSRKLGGNTMLVAGRIQRGWTPIAAVTTPKHKR